MNTREQSQVWCRVEAEGQAPPVWAPSVSTGMVDAVPVEAESLRAVADCENRLHAVRSGLAAMSNSLHLLTDRRDDLSEASRRRLETLLMEEIERLRRMLAPPAGDPKPDVIVEIELDVLVGNVVLGRRICGQEVAWTPSGCRVRARTDDVVEALNILLVNAWRHAHGAPARIEVFREGSSVLIQVSDDGPGVLPELGERIFERAVRRPGSSGQGLGLAMARELVESMGGSLTLAWPGSVGASFCLVLPAEQETTG